VTVDSEPLRGPSNYVVCNIPRSGSTLLCDALGATGRLGQPDEYVHSVLEQSWAEAQNQQIHTTTYSEYLAELHRQHRTRGGRFGIKLNMSQLERLRILQSFEAGSPLTAAEVLEQAFSDAVFIYIRRRDLIRQAVSWARASQTLQWKSTDQAIERPAEFDADAISARLRDIVDDETAWTAAFSERGIAPLHVYYEDLESDPVGVALQTAQAIDPTLDESVLDGYVPGVDRQRDRLNDEWYRRYIEIIAEGSIDNGSHRAINGADLYTRARYLVGRNHYSRALFEADRVAATSIPYANVIRAEAAFAAGDVDTAFSLATEARSKIGDHPPLLLVLARILRTRGDVPAARTILETLVAGAPQNTQFQIELAGCLAKLGEASDALALLNTVVDRGHREAGWRDAYYWRGYCNLELGHPGLAVEDFDRHVSYAGFETDAERREVIAAAWGQGPADRSCRLDSERGPELDGAWYFPNPDRSARTSAEMGGRTPDTTPRTDDESTEQPSVLFITVHKGASTFVAGDLAPAIGQALPDHRVVAFGSQLINGTSPCDMAVPSERSVFVRLYPGDLESIHFENKNRPLDDLTLVLLSRDPRDAAISLYYSVAYSHTTVVANTERFLAMRDSLQQASVAEGILSCSETAIREFKKMQAIARAHPNALVTTYEELVLQYPTWLRRVCRHAGWSEDVSQQIATITGDPFGPPATEDRNQHIRRITPGNWRNLFDERLVDHFQSWCGDEMERAGYLWL